MMGDSLQDLIAEACFQMFCGFLLAGGIGCWLPCFWDDCEAEKIPFDVQTFQEPSWSISRSPPTQEFVLLKVDNLGYFAQWCRSCLHETRHTSRVVSSFQDQLSKF